MRIQLRATFALLALAALLWVSAWLFGPRPTAAQVTIQLTTTPTFAGTPGYLPLVFKDWPPPSPTPTLPFGLLFVKTADSPAYLPNFANGNGCAWFGISGQVFDLNRMGVLGMIVRVTGPNGFQSDAITGSVPKYGASGWEITLGTTPVDSNDYSIQLLTGSGLVRSENHVVPTSSQCNRVHIIFNFEQTY